MSIQQNFPAISPSLSLNFARSKTLDPRITFTRTTSGTRTNERGLVEVVPANSPRFDHSYDPVSGTVRSLGLLVEESRSNSLLWSEDFSNWTVTNGSVQSNVITAPDGNVTADKLVENSSTGNKEVNRGSITFTSGTSLTYSCFVKASERSLFRLAATSAFFGSGTNAYFDLTSGTVYSITGGVTSASIIPYPNGWYRCIATILPTSSGTGNVFITLILSGVTSNYTGDGTSGIYIWGAQLEQGSFPTSYIPTTNSTVTRTPDNVSMVGENFSSWYNQEQGSFLWIGNVYSREISPVQPFRVNQGANLRGLGIQFDTRSINNSTNFASRTQSSNIPSKIAPSGIIPSDNKIKIAGGYIESVGLSTIRAAFNGLPEDSYSGYTQTDITYDTMNELEIMGNRGITGTNYQFTGVCEQLVYYPRILSDDQLQNLTK
jgi:hypothetical protein